jgi:metal-responsive CopG/Arc/MetJ family transcriptional regulator
MGTRRASTISVPPSLLKRAERIARHEHRSKSELLRDALRLYVESKAVRQTAAREPAIAVIDRVQARTENTPPKSIRKIIREAIVAARRGRRRATA